MAQNNISLAAARGNFLTWCISGYLPLPDFCRPLYVAQALPDRLGVAGGVEVGETYRVYSANQARELFGAGSVAALMAIQHFCTCPELPLFIAPLPEPASGAVAAVWKMAIAGPATASGVFTLSIFDMQFAVGVIVGTPASDVAASLAEALNKNRDLPFTADDVGDDVMLTAKNVGPSGNAFHVELSPNFGEQLPAGISVTITQETQGVAVLDPTDVVPVMACPWDCIALGTEDEQVVQLFIQAVRQNWVCGVQGDFRDGHVFHSRTDTAGHIGEYAEERNNPEESVIPVRGEREDVGGGSFIVRPVYKYPGYLLVAAIASRFCCSACTDPARPVQYDNGVMGCLFDSLRCATVWAPEEKRMFYDMGVLNWDVAYSRGVRQASLVIEEGLTTYKFAPTTGALDGAWQRVEYRYTVAYFIRALGQWYRRNYASVALVNNGTPIPGGRRAVSPRIFQASVLAWLRTTQLGVTMDVDPATLERMVIVERTNTPDNCDPSRLNVRIDLDLVNQLARIATSVDVSPEFACIAPALGGAVAGLGGF